MSPHIEYLLPIEVDPACIPVLRQYPELLPILKALPGQIHRPEHFPGARLKLRRKKRYDSWELEGVVLDIYDDMGGTAALERLDTFDVSFWLDNMHPNLNVHIGYD